MNYVGYLLVVVHLILFVWSLGGFLEMMLSSVPWQPYTNLDFPSWLLPFHWGFALITGAGFLYGYFTEWEKTPHFMMVAYGMLALLCALETTKFMTSETKYFAMIAEYIAYRLILLLLFKTTYFVNLFK